MDIQNARKIADAITLGFERPKTREIRQQNVFGALYLLLAEDPADCVCAFIVYGDRNQKIAIALYTLIETIPNYPDDDCQFVLHNFMSIVTGKIAISTPDILRQRAQAFLDEYKAGKIDPERQKAYIEAMDDLEKQN